MERHVLPVDCSFSEPALLNSNSMFLSNTRQILSSSHQKVNCSLNGISQNIAQLALSYNHSLTKTEIIFISYCKRILPCHKTHVKFRFRSMKKLKKRPLFFSIFWLRVKLFISTICCMFNYCCTLRLLHA